MFCDKCGLQMLAVQSTCGCGAVATRHWLQFVSILTLLLAGVMNFFVIRSMMSTALGNASLPFLIRIWIGISEFLSIHGWLVLAVALLVWAFWPHHGYTPEMPVRIGQGLLILALLSGLTGVIFPFIGADWAKGVNDFLAGNPGVIPTLNWSLVVLALGGICYNAETRDFLLGTGKILSMVSLGVLSLVIILSIATWASIDNGEEASMPATESVAAPEAEPPPPPAE